MKPSGIITLLSDFGLSDPYVAQMKGVILSFNPKALLVDITHEIPPGAIFEAARMIRETYRFFPPGTIHVGVVDPGVGSGRRLVALEADGHAFVGPDNGLLWLVLQIAGESRIVHLKESRFFLSPVSPTFHGRDVFAPVAAHLSMGVEIEEMGDLISDPRPLLFPTPRRQGEWLHGQIIHVDRFGNLISNIESEELLRFLGSSIPSIHVGTLNIRGLNRIYSDVEEGQPLAFINSSNLLEVAVNMGRASEYVGVEREDLVGTAVKVAKT